MQANQNIASNNLSKNNLEKNTFLQIIPITISNGTKYIKTNVLLDTGSDATLLKGDIAKILGLTVITKTFELQMLFLRLQNQNRSMFLSKYHPNRTLILLT